MQVAFLGVGHWHAAMHVDAALALGATTCAVWDADVAVARGFGAQFGAPTAGTLDEALAARPDLCVVMERPTSAPALAARVVDAGIPMVLEKPAAPSSSALRELHMRAERRDVFVAVPLPHRLGPAMSGLDARDTPVVHASFRIVNGPPRRYRDDGVAWMLTPEAGGGALRNLGIHGVDSALSLARGSLHVASAHLARRLHPEEAIEDHALVTLIDEAGALFSVEAGYTTPSLAAGGDHEWRVATRGEYRIDRGDSALSIGVDGARPLAPLPLVDRYRAFMADTMERLRDGRPPLVTLADYVAAMEVIDAAYARAAA